MKKERTVAYTDSSKLVKLRKELEFKIDQLTEHLSIIAQINSHLNESFQSRAEVEAYIEKLGYRNLAFGADSQGFRTLYLSLVNSTRPEISEELAEVKNLKVVQKPEAMDILRQKATEYVAEEYQDAVYMVQEFIEKFNMLSRQERRALTIQNGELKYNVAMLAFVRE
ncbi:hypothetical protein ACOCEA_10080 [Maribacter sp. CXY002]|uniref:hypothetical protein n=1 Tax=Maribacter luteocoastalis TaxID=3407671 RepID=UPI003B670B50